MESGKINVKTWLTGPPPAKGQHQRYPGRFLYNIRQNYPAFMDNDTLHLFSGSCEFGISCDFRHESGADIISDFRDVPSIFGDFRVPATLADPPYADHWQNQWHGDLPRPKDILRVAASVTKPGGLIGILHIIVIPAYKVLGVRRIGLHPILSGPNNAMRVFNVFERI